MYTQTRFRFSLGAYDFDAEIWDGISSLPQDSRIGLDTETTLIVPGKVPDIVTLQVYYPSLDFVHIIQGKELTDKYLTELLDMNPASELIWHNACFDYEVLGGKKNVKLFRSLKQDRTFQKFINNTWETCSFKRWTDVGIRWRLKLTEEGLFNGPVKWSLDHVTQELLGIVLPKDDAIRLTFKPDMVMSDEHVRYACTDPVATVKCRDAMPEPYPTEDIQLLASIVLNDISLRGMYVDKEEFAKLTKKFTEICKINDKVLHTFGYFPKRDGQNSVKGCKSRLLRIMENIEERCGLIFPRSAKKGEISTSSKVIEQFPDKAHPFLQALKDGQNAAKIIGTYLNTELIAEDGRAHPTFNLILKTGRTSCSQPNLQNLPRGGGVRRVYRSLPGYVTICTDYCQQELVTLAENCFTKYGHSVMMELINQGVDLHNFFGQKIKEIDPHPSESTDYRQCAKAFNFGKPGGLGKYTFIAYAKGSYGVILTAEQVDLMSDMWLNTFPEMKEHLNPPRDPNNKDRFIGVILSGRTKPNMSFCAAANVQFQGLSSDCSKLAGWLLYQNNVKLVNFVHDEYIAEQPIDDKLQDTCKLIAKLMIDGMKILTPNVAVRVEQAMMVNWDKKAKGIYSLNNDLLCWTPDIIVISAKDKKESWKKYIPYSFQDIMTMSPEDIVQKCPREFRVVWTEHAKAPFGIQPVTSIVV